VKDTNYHIVTRYDGTNFDIYINGMLNSHTTHSGKIMTTSLDLTIGQHLPDNPGYNFKGILDEIYIYNYALSEQEIQNLYSLFTDVMSTDDPRLPNQTMLYQNYPNPFNASTTISYQLKNEEHVRIILFNMLGQSIRTLVDEKKSAGSYVINWDGRHDNGSQVSSGIYIYQMHAGEFKQSHKLILLD
jgi:hypothetical protein